MSRFGLDFLFRIYSKGRVDFRGSFRPHYIGAVLVRFSNEVATTGENSEADYFLIVLRWVQDASWVGDALLGGSPRKITSLLQRLTGLRSSVVLWSTGRECRRQFGVVRLRTNRLSPRGMCKKIALRAYVMLGLCYLQATNRV